MILFWHYLIFFSHLILFKQTSFIFLVTNSWLTDHRCFVRPLQPSVYYNPGDFRLRKSRFLSCPHSNPFHRDRSSSHTRLQLHKRLPFKELPAMYRSMCFCWFQWAHTSLTVTFAMVKCIFSFEGNHFGIVWLQPACTLTKLSSLFLLSNLIHFHKSLLDNKAWLQPNFTTHRACCLLHWLVSSKW